MSVTVFHFDSEVQRKQLEACLAFSSVLRRRLERKVGSFKTVIYSDPK